MIEIIQLFDEEFPIESKLAFEEAYQLYLKKDWRLAITRFIDANQIFRSAKLRDDLVCAIYIERCENFIVHPPQEEWSGIWEMSDK